MLVTFKKMSKYSTYNVHYNLKEFSLDLDSNQHLPENVVLKDACDTIPINILTKFMLCENETFSRKRFQN